MYFLVEKEKQSQAPEHSRKGEGRGREAQGKTPTLAFSPTVVLAGSEKGLQGWCHRVW